MKVTVVGLGYVGLSLSVLIARKHHVVAVDIDEGRLKLLKAGMSPIEDREIKEKLSEGRLDLELTSDISKCAGSDYVIVATPTNYDAKTQYFNTDSVEKVIADVNRMAPKSTVIIKSTVPVGYTKNLCKKLNCKNIVFSPEFLREGRALYDNLHPSRIIAGIPDESSREKAEMFVGLLAECSEEKDVKRMVIGSTEAESVKLFSNTYLAMRVAFFNELDTFAEKNNLDAHEIITGVCMDFRIGNYYNNPSFGYGGYCLPKDTKQLLANYKKTPNSLIYAVVESNAVRKKFIADEVVRRLKDKKGTVGIYRLSMKTDSDNFRESSIIDIMKDLSFRGLKVVVYEPTVDKKFENYEVENNLKKFCEMSDIILANRQSSELNAYMGKVFCRDLYRRD